MTRRLVITVCPRERGTVALPIEKSGRRERMDSTRIVVHLQELIARRRLGDRIRILQACAGGCAGPGPNVSVALFPMTPPGERPDHVAVGWKTYVATIGSLDCLARIIDENLSPDAPPAPIASSTPRQRKRPDR